MMKKIDRRLRISIGIAIASAIVISVLGAKAQLEKGKLGLGEKAKTEVLIEEKATLTIDDGTGSPQEFEAEVREGDTVFDLLKRTGVDIECTESEVGIFIDALGGIFNDKEENKYWMYYINGEMAKEGVGKQVARSNDSIEFRYEKVNW